MKKLLLSTSAAVLLVGYVTTQEWKVWYLEKMLIRWRNENMTLAYIDIRPFLFVIGLPVVILLAILVCWIVKARIAKWRVALFTTATFAGLFGFFLYGPFIGQTETREHIMTWTIDPTPSSRINEPKVILSFVEFPDYFIGGYSDEIAAHLKKNGKDKVNVIFEITSDYGKFRGYRETEIAGLKSWQWIDGFGGSKGSPEKSPWD